jgi:hypothetical protein
MSLLEEMSRLLPERYFQDRDIDHLGEFFSRPASFSRLDRLPSEKLHY